MSFIRYWNSSKIYREMHKQIYVNKKADGLYFYEGYNEIKEFQPN